MKNYSKKVIIILLPIILLINGCINYEEKVKLNDDYSGSMTIHYSTGTKYLKIFDTSSTGFSFKSEDVEKNFSGKGVKINSFKTYTEEGNQHMLIELEFENILNLNNLIFFENQPFELTDGASGQKILNRKIRSAGDFGTDVLSSFKFKFEYDLPGEIITDNSTNKKDKTLIWEYSLSELKEPKTLSVTFSTSKFSRKHLIYAGGGFILLLFIYLIAKRRKTIKRYR